MNTLNQGNDIISVQIFLDRKKNRTCVGRLSCESKNSDLYFYFKYDTQYLKRKYALPLGPELPLTPQLFQSTKLFASFQDRIPDKENPAYPEYCKEAGVSEQEKNPMILLSTIGKYGPSSFVFEMDVNEQFSASDLKRYRKHLKLTIREFAALFSISPSHLQKIESKKFTGKDILRLIEIYHKYPETALDQVKRNSKFLHYNKYLKVFDILQNEKRQLFRKNIENIYKFEVPSPAFNEHEVWSANTLTETEVKNTLSLIGKLKEPAWVKFLNSKNIKDSIASVQSYDLLVKRLDNTPQINDLHKCDIPTIIKTNENDIWVYGSDNNGKPQLNRINNEDYGNVCKIEFLEKPYKLKILMQLKPEIYFILNKKYHIHFNYDTILKIKSFFFEIRFAYSMFSSGLQFEHEFLTGEMKKSVDFKIYENKTKSNFLVELASMRDSVRIKEEIKQNCGINLTYLNSDKEDSAKIKEAHRVQNIILEKSHKFPEISKGNYHIIIVDMRGFQGGSCDKEDCHHLAYGGKQLSDLYKIPYIDADGKSRLLKGIFEDHSYRFQEVKEKIHAVGFILEESYKENEIKTKINLCKNPLLITTKNESEILSHLFYR